MNSAATVCTIALSPPAREQLRVDLLDAIKSGALRMRVSAPGGWVPVDTCDAEDLSAFGAPTVHRLAREWLAGWAVGMGLDCVLSLDSDLVAQVRAAAIARRN